MSDGTREQLEQTVRGTRDDLERLIVIAQGDYEPGDDTVLLESHGYDLDDPDDPEAAIEAAQTVLDEWPLEVVEHGKRAPGGEWEYDHSTVVFGTGGPHIELDTSERQVIGYWGGDIARAGVSDTVVDYFEGMSE